MYKQIDYLKVFSMFLAFLLIGSCSSDENGSPQTIPSDQQIEATLTDQYQKAPSIDAASIKVEVTDGIVTLSGEAASMLARNKAMDIAKITKGVRSIVNDIAIQTSRKDEDITKDIATALLADPATEPYEFGVDVKNGLAILTGTVNSWQERKIAQRIAAGVKGVTGIENRITLESTAARSDTDIKQDIEETLAWDVRINDGPIKVKVENGTVYLSGSVGSVMVKELVQGKAHVKGVHEVQADKLEVMPAMHDSMVRIKEPDLADDEIEDAIKRAWAKNPRVMQYDLTVEVDQGVATLSGKVDNLSSKLAAATTVRNTIGVEAVNNNIETEQKVVVRPDLDTTDEAIKDRIRAAIIRDPYSEIDEVTIDVENGVVELSGTVQSNFERDHITQLASNTVGVLTINNHIDVEPIKTSM